MQHQIDDFNFSITNILISHKWTFNVNSNFTCLDGRKSYGLVYLLNGQLFFKFLDGRSITLNPGDAILLKPNDRYKITCEIPSTHYTVNFNLANSSIEGEVAKNTFLNKGNPTVCTNFTTSALVNNFENLCNVWQKKEFGYRIQSITIANKLLFEFIKKYISFEISDDYKKIQPAIKLMEKNWNKNLTLTNLAKECNLSISHFRHLFTNLLKMAPMEYRDSLRLLYAKDYLMWKVYSIKEIANLCGFDDVNYFNRFFKKHIGVTPSKYI